MFNLRSKLKKKTDTNLPLSCKVFKRLAVTCRVKCFKTPLCVTPLNGNWCGRQADNAYQNYQQN